MHVWKLLISPSNLNEIQARQSILGCRFFPFITLNILGQSLLACRVSVEKSAYIILLVCVYVIGHFTFVAFNILSLSLIFVILITVCLGVFLLGFILPGTFCTSWAWLTTSFPLVREVFSLISSNIFLGPFSLLLEPYNGNVGQSFFFWNQSVFYNLSKETSELSFNKMQILLNQLCV